MWTNANNNVSLIHSAMNCRYNETYHFAFNLLLHYLAKFECLTVHFYRRHGHMVIHILFQSGGISFIRTNCLTSIPRSNVYANYYYY